MDAVTRQGHGQSCGDTGTAGVTRWPGMQGTVSTRLSPEWWEWVSPRQSQGHRGLWWRYSGVDTALGEAGPELSLAPPPLPSSGPSALPTHPTPALPGPGAAHILPLPLSDASLKSYLSSCSPFPPCPGLICLLPPIHPPPASHLWPLPLPARGPQPLSCPVLSARQISALWVRTLPTASCVP